MSIFDQPDLFKSDVEKAKNILKECGYSVRDAKRNYITPASKLVSHFYQRLSFVKRTDLYSRNEGKDRSIAKSLLSRFIEIGLSQEKALDISFEIINYLIMNESKLGIRFSVVDMNVLGQGKMKWLTDRIIREIDLEEEYRNEIEFAELDESLEKQNPEVNHTSKMDELKDIIRRMKNGAEEEKG